MKGIERDSLYYLNNPKIILDLTLKLLKINKNLEAIENTIIDIPSNKPSNDFSNKFDKRYKNNDIDSIDIKKNKNKLNKKTRKNIDIDNNDLLNDDPLGLG
uniref:Uncharacterized protein n=1 Tax=Anotrichium furcellatum TaxID=41999 RepID=A0A4D6WKH6_9FLOR|nr:hypothetical protein [Anotrichium furcellatum]